MDREYCFWFLLLTTTANTLVKGQGTTRVGFYSTTCPRAEEIVRSNVESHFRSNPTIAPGLLRMNFHDCFVQGCDASVLIDGPNTKKTAPPNLQLGGYEVIDDAKKQLEAVCSGVVSCADILALAACDSVVLTKGPNWNAPTGLKDGRVSSASEASNLPSFRDSVEKQREKFYAFVLNALDPVTLVGGHTLRTSACQFFSYRLYNFSTTGNGADPPIYPAFFNQLRALCPQNGDGSKCVALDTGSDTRFDTSFLNNLKNGRGVLESDQKLWTDASTKCFVRGFSRGSSFNKQFGRSMVKMSLTGVKTSANGEVRKICSKIN
ncbi:cationic peroxidase 2-like [Mangifera indica]|uniref:cationic peroxidase 2-like n=1 Tax=Mangifera indica TaxID=29780 RepID=UPI001CFABB01|nr:cationic peroxidase 2-like [Mangifera indica]